MIEKRAYGGYRDPVSGMTHDEYYSKKYRKRIITIISLAFIVVFLLIFYYFISKATTEKETAIKELKYMKCSSQCPLTYESSGRFFVQSCVQNCSMKYMANLTNEEKLVISSESGRFANITAGYKFCLNNMQSSVEFDYQTCFTNFFNANGDIANFSDFLRYPVGLAN